MRTAENRESSQIALFRDSLPHRPYCANDLTYGLRIRNQQNALKHSHIQPNPPMSKRWLIMDIDRGISPDEIENDNLPAPNIFVQNPENHHAHLYYSLEKPVYTGAESSVKANYYAALVDDSLTVALEADPHYTGFIAKNPTHPQWITNVIQPESYSLDQLAEYLELKARKKNRSAEVIQVSGQGSRNNDTFDRLRHWAYLHVADYSEFKPYSAVIMRKADEYNRLNFPGLPMSEINATARSVAKWTWQQRQPGGILAKRLPYDEWVKVRHSSERQKARSKKGVKAKQKISLSRQDQAKELLNQGMKRLDIAKALNLSDRQLRRLLNV